MSRIIGISGKKQSGKNTSANYLHGNLMFRKGLVKDFVLDEDGKLHINTVSTETGEEGWGEFDLSRRDIDFVEYCDREIWPYIKLYAFSDYLKIICGRLFNIPQEALYGTNDQKNQKLEHLRWENMPGVRTKKGKVPSGMVYHAEGPMTAREFMQFFGTKIVRKMYGPAWIEACMNQIADEQPELALIEGVRFPDECQAIFDAGGEVVRLTREPFEDEDESEVALDGYEAFTAVCDNENGSISDLTTWWDQYMKGGKPV